MPLGDIKVVVPMVAGVLAILLFVKNKGALRGCAIRAVAPFACSSYKFEAVNPSVARFSTEPISRINLNIAVKLQTNK